MFEVKATFDDIQHDGTGSDDDDTNKTGDVLAILVMGKK